MLVWPLSSHHGPGLELFGTEGTLYLHGDDWDPDGYELWQNRAGCWQRFKETRPDWPWADGLTHLVDCVQNQQPLRVTPEHAYHVLEIMVRAQEAAKDGVTRLLDSSFPPLATHESDIAIAAHRVHDRTRVE
jgi:predicted dehydrogenase